MKNYNKIFLTVFIIIFLVGMLVSPANKLLAHFGIIEYEDRANYIDPVIHQGPFANVLNGISKAQAQVDDTYTNYIPAYNTIVDGVVKAKHNFNEPFTKWLGEIAKITGTQQALKPSKPSGAQNTNSSTTSKYNENFDYSGGIGSVENVGGNKNNRPVTSQTSSTQSSSGTSSQVTSKPSQKPIAMGVTANFIKKKGSYSYFTFDFRTPLGKQGHFLDKIITTDMSKTTRPSVEGAQKMNRLANRVPNVNMYIYLCTRLSETSLRDDCLGDYKGGTKENLHEFLNTLNSNIGKDYFKVDTLDDRINKVYLTDHHWNAAGLDEAYGEIISMIRKKVPSIPNKRKGTLYSVKPKYYGTYVNDMTSLFPVWDYCMDNNLYDDFSFYDYNLPAHTQMGGVPFANSKKKYLANSFTGEGIKDFYNDFYQSADYYNYQSNNTGHNLFILGDSFSVSVNELIASHFDETYFLDIRDVSSKNPFNLKEFCDQYGITDILILQNSYQLIYLETAGSWGNVQ